MIVSMSLHAAQKALHRRNKDGCEARDTGAAQMALQCGIVGWRHGQL